MNKRNLFIIFSLLTALLFSLGCNNNEQPYENNPDLNQPTLNNELNSSFNFSDGLDYNGFWIGISALEYVYNLDFLPLIIPREIHYVSDELIQREIENILNHSLFADITNITNRSVEFGDRVNIDFVGSVGGVEFEGGSTQGMGSYVTAGSRDFIDDFLDQIIGAMPGDVVYVEVRFPDIYPQEPSLQGAEALFITTINYIQEASPPLLTDDFVVHELSPFFGAVSTVEEFEFLVASELKELAKSDIEMHISHYLRNNVTLRSIPENILNYQKYSFIYEVTLDAEDNGLDLLSYLSLHGYDSLEDILDDFIIYFQEMSTFHLIIQAIAESRNIFVSETDVANFFVDNEILIDISELEEIYGMPYIKKMILVSFVMDYLTNTAIFE